MATGITPDASVLDAARAMERNSRQPMLIHQQGMPVGFLTEDDIVDKVLAAGRDPRTVRIAEIMGAVYPAANGQLIVDAGIDVAHLLHSAEPLSAQADTEPRQRRTLDQTGTCQECETEHEFLVDLQGLILCEDCLEDHDETT